MTGLVNATNTIETALRTLYLCFFHCHCRRTDSPGRRRWCRSVLLGRQYQRHGGTLDNGTFRGVAAVGYHPDAC